MESQKTIKLYVYVDGVNDIPFYGSDASEYEEFILSNGEQFILSNGFIFNVRNANEQIEIGSFRYDAKRMGGAPTISFTLMYEDCLDNFWGENVYAVFNGEKYFLKQTPTSSLSNEDARYKHEVELISERVALDNVYFFDAVVGVPQESDKPVSNSSKVVFFGDIHEFAHRMNASLEYTKLLKWEDGVDDEGNAIKIANGYNIVVDEGITSEEKLMSFEDQFFSNVLQEIYNTYEVPYYFVGKTIHIGFANDAVVPPTFAYGVDDALLSITKNNANYKIVNRATGTGSSDNIPYYYPNNSPKGVIAAVSSNPNVEAKVLDYELYADKVKLDGVVRKSNIEYANVKVTHTAEEEIVSGQTFSAQMGGGGKGTSFYISFDAEEAGIFLLNFSSEVFRFLQNGVEKDDATIGVSYGITLLDETDSNKIVGDTLYEDYNVKEIDNYEVPIPFAGHKYKIRVEVSYSAQGKYSGKAGQIVYDASYSFGGASGWMYEDKVVELKDLGLFVEGDSNSGDTITQKLVEYINTSQNLMPYKYRETKGKERFYNATNGTYEGVAFNNPFIEGKPKEHIIEVEDIKPTIKEAVNAMGLRMDMFSEFAYDLNDNDETIENEEGSQRDYVHSYFFGKLRKLDFNLFEHAIENQPMTISFTGGDCGACNFEIGVTEEFPQKNPVLVNADGTLKRDEDGNVICGQFQEVTEDEIQDIQQDTINNEVWIALKKEDSTYGILMPKAPTKEVDENGDEYEVGGHRPKPCTEGQNDGDTFVILGINLPESYIINAEKKLEAEIIKYLQENNDEKFTFSINFSRIYFEENPDVLDYLNENSRINVTYNGKTYLLYVTSFSYSMGEGDVLPEIRVELDESLVVSQNALQNAINQVKSEVGRALSNIDTLALAQPYFIRKDIDDEANGKINFTKGIKFGEGGKVEVLDNNSAKLTIEYLEVTKKASFTSLEVKEKTHVGGQIIISPAAMTCGEVEELENAYRCYFQTKGEEGGDEIFNQFAINDLAICQTYNAWGSRYYWRKVVGVGEDYIDLSKTICDEGSGIPMAGDKIVQLGNTEDAARQAAQVLSAYGDDAPSFIMYNGINDFTLEGKNITGVIWNPNTQEPQMYSYGSFYFGDRNLEDNFITFQKKEGDEKKSLHINANVTIGADSSGLTNLSEWSEKQAEINKAQSDATAAQQTANVANASVSTLNTRIDAFDETIEEINNKLDGVVESYFDDYTPSRTNEPAATWITEGTEADHIGDTFTNTALEGEDAGKSWRWLEQSNGTYDWQQIADSDAAKALALAGQAKATADGKTTTFLATPSNYSVGDIWIVGDVVPEGFLFKRGDILTTSNSSVDYVANHWHKFINYNDSFQVELDKKVGELEDSISEAEKAAKDYTDEGKSALQGAINELNQAKANVVDVYTKAQSDGKISESEQRAIDAADDYATQAKQAAVVASNAYADGVATKAEKDAIDAANKSLADAKEELNKAIAAIEQEVSDTAYLGETFKEGSTEIEGGVVMSEMVAVKNSEEKIEAFLNGSDNEDFIDNEHGKLILASGIPVDGENLKERAKEAKTKMYEDGRFETTEGKMELMRVNSMRGMVSQIDAVIHFGQTPWYITEFRAYNGLSNSPDDIILGGYKTEPTEKTMSTGWPLDWNTEPDLTWDYTQIGRRRTFIHHKATSGYESNWCSLYAPDYEERPNDTSGLYPPYFYVDGTPRKYLDIYPNDCIQLYGYGYPTKEDRSEGVFMGWIVTNRTPIFGGVNKYHLSGMQEGLRPKVRTITSSETLSELDHTVIINNSSAITITLPSNPQEGQTYKILHPSAVGVTIDWNGSRAMNVSTGNTPNVTFSARRSVVLTYCSGTWYAEYLELAN